MSDNNIIDSNSSDAAIDIDDVMKFQFDVKAIKEDPLHYEFRIHVNSEFVNKVFTHYLEKLQKNSKPVPGFRKDKLPMSVLAKKHGTEVWGDVISSVIGMGNKYVMQKYGVERTCGIKSDAEVANLEEFVYVLTLFPAPAVPAINLSSIRAIKPVLKELSQTDVDDLADFFAKDNPKLVGKDSIQSKDDVIDIEVKAQIESKKSTSLKEFVERQKVVSSSFDKELPGMWELLNGRASGDKFESNYSFQNDERYGVFSGNTYKMLFHVHGVFDAHVLPIGEELAQLTGFKNEDELVRALSSEAERMMEARCRQLLRRNVLFAMWSAAKNVQCAQAMVDAECERISQAIKGEDEATCKKLAKYRVQTWIIVSDIAHKYAVRVSEDEARKYIEAAQQEVSAELINEITPFLFEEKVIETVLSRAEVTEQECSSEQIKEMESEDLLGAKPQFSVEDAENTGAAKK